MSKICAKIYLLWFTDDDLCKALQEGGFELLGKLIDHKRMRRLSEWLEQNLEGAPLQMLAQRKREEKAR